MCWSLYNHWLLLVNPGIEAFLAGRPRTERKGTKLPPPGSGARLPTSKP
jgi:hypothetical protein